MNTHAVRRPLAGVLRDCAPIIVAVCFAPSFACAPQPRPAAAAQQAAGTAAWWRDAVCYEVFVRSFADANGDGIGDLKGLTERLDYVNDGNPRTTTDLGANCLWLMPITKSPSYHG